MNKYISKTLLLLLCITFLGNNVRATEPVSGANQSSGKIALLCMGAMAVGGLTKIACNYFNNRNMQRAAQNLLDSYLKQKPDAFQKYRSGDYCSDEKCYKTPKEISDNAGIFCEIVCEDIRLNRIVTQEEKEQIIMQMKQGQQIKQKQEPNFNRKKEKLKTIVTVTEPSQIVIEPSERDIFKRIFFNIREKIFKEEKKPLYEAIIRLTGYTDVYIHIANLINEGKTSKFSWSSVVKDVSLGNIKDPDDYYVIFKKFDDIQLEDFKKELLRRVSANNSFWKRFTNPYYKELSEQYWELLNKYMRVCAIDNAIAPYYLNKYLNNNSNNSGESE